jgi:hypothetical protein
LYDPHAAFGLTLLLMFVLTAMISVARALDHGKAFFQFPMDLVSLRRLSVICIFIGIAGNLAYSTGVSATGTVTLGGPAVVLGAAFRQYYYFGLNTETVYAVIKSGGRSFVTRRLVFLYLIQSVISIVFNERGGLVSGLIGIIAIAFCTICFVSVMSLWVSLRVAFSSLFSLQ